MTSCCSVSFIVAYCRLAFNCAFRFAAGSNTWVVLLVAMFFFLEGRELNTFTMVDQLLIFPINSSQPSWQEILSIQTPYGIGLMPKYPLTQGFSMGVDRPICTPWNADSPGWPKRSKLRLDTCNVEATKNCRFMYSPSAYREFSWSWKAHIQTRKVRPCERVVFLRCFFLVKERNKKHLHPTWTLFSSKIACKCGRNDPSVGKGMDSISWNFQCSTLSTWSSNLLLVGDPSIPE